MINYKNIYHIGDKIDIGVSHKQIVWDYYGTDLEIWKQCGQNNWSIIKYYSKGVYVQCFDTDVSHPILVPWKAIIKIARKNNPNKIKPCFDNIKISQYFITNDGRVFHAIKKDIDNRKIKFINAIYETYGHPVEDNYIEIEESNLKTLILFDAF